MPKWTAESVSQRLFDLRLLDTRQLEGVWADLRTREVSLEDFTSRLLRKELVTSFQLDKVLRDEKEGFFYGDYRVQYIVGAGTFARVFRSLHMETKRVLAVKVLRRRYRADPDQVDLFLREARMGLQLRHFNIVRIHDVSDNIKAPFMAMDFVEGQTLREFLKARGKLDLGTTLRLMIDVMSGLDYAHKLGITHRDMKLSNVMITSTGRAKLVDFGLATIAESDDKSLTTAPNARSIDYVALERGTGVRKNDVRSDVYFAGCIMYHTLTGVAPLFETRDRLQRMNISRFHEIKPIQTLAPTLPANVVSVVNRAMTYMPDKRYQEPGEMLADLKRTQQVLEHEAEHHAEEAAAAAGQPAEVAEPDVPTLSGHEGEGRTVMFIEADPEMQNVFREQLKKRGYRVLITTDPVRAVQRLSEHLGVAHGVVFSTQALGPQALAGFNRLGEIELTKGLPAILLVDKRRLELLDSALTAPHRLALAMPVSVKDLRLKLHQLLTAKPAE